MEEKNYVGLTEEQLGELGFILEDGETVGEHKWYYYTYDLSETNKNFCLITNASDEAKDKLYTVQLFNVDDYVFTDFNILKQFINTLKLSKSNG